MALSFSIMGQVNEILYFRKRWMISLMLIEWFDERSRKKKILIFRQVWFHKVLWEHQQCCLQTPPADPCCADSSVTRYAVWCPAERPDFFHRPGYILQNGSKEKQERKISCIISVPHQRSLYAQLFLQDSTGFWLDFHGPTCVCT